MYAYIFINHIYVAVVICFHQRYIWLSISNCHISRLFALSASPHYSRVTVITDAMLDETSRTDKLFISLVCIQATLHLKVCNSLITEWQHMSREPGGLLWRFLMKLWLFFMVVFVQANSNADYINMNKIWVKVNILRLPGLSYRFLLEIPVFSIIMYVSDTECQMVFLFLSVYGVHR